MDGGSVMPITLTVRTTWAAHAANRADDYGPEFMEELSRHVYNEFINHFGKPVGVSLQWVGDAGPLRETWIITTSETVGKRSKTRAWMASLKPGHAPLAEGSYAFHALKIPTHE